MYQNLLSTISKTLMSYGTNFLNDDHSKEIESLSNAFLDSLLLKRLKYHDGLWSKNEEA